MKATALNTERLHIRDHRPEDIISHHELMSDKKIMLYLQDIMSHNLDDSRNNLDLAIGEIKNPNRKLYFFRIEMKNSGEHVGEIGYTVKIFAPQGKSVEVGYFIREKFWGQGISTEALREVIRFAFEENDVFRISCGCAKENTGSERVMQKCGLIKEADLKRYQLQDGEMIDRVIYRLLKSEWCAEKSRKGVFGMNLSSKIDSYVGSYIDSYKEAMIRDLGRMIEVPSVSEDLENVKKMLKLSIDIARELGFEAKMVLDERVGVIELGEGSETIGMLAHVDVVPPGDLSKWATEPFIPTVKGELMFGRGTIDDKGPLIASLYAMKALKDSGQKFHKKIQLILGTQEEVDWTEMDEYVTKFPLPDYGFTPDGSFPITNIEKGYTDIELHFSMDYYDSDKIDSDKIDSDKHAEFEIADFQGGSSVNSTPGEAVVIVKGNTDEIKNIVSNYKPEEKESIILSEENGLVKIVVKGESVHSAYPEGGVNAIWTACKLFAGRKVKMNGCGRFVKFINDKSVSCYYGEKLGLLNDSEYNENGEFIHKNTVVPTYAKVADGKMGVNFNIRNTHGTARKDIEDAFGKLTDGYGYAAKVTTYMDSLYVEKNKPFLKLMAEVYDELSGFKNEFKISYGSTYAKAMANIVAWGPIFPDENDYCHEVNENINLRNLYKAAKIYATALARMAFVEESFK